MKDGEIISEKIIHEDQDLIDLEKEINQDEVESKNFREIDVHNLNVEKLDEKEQSDLLFYLNKVHDENKDILANYKVRNIP